MHIVYIAERSIILFLDDDLSIMNAAKVRVSYRPEPCVIRLRGIGTTASGKPSISGDYFITDGLGCIRLLWWTILQYPSYRQNGIRNRYEALFANGADNDALIAALRVFNGTWRDAPGESGYFCNQQWEHHPAEMGALALLGAFGRQPHATDWSAAI